MTPNTTPRGHDARQSQIEVDPQHRRRIAARRLDRCDGLRGGFAALYLTGGVRRCRGRARPAAGPGDSSAWSAEGGIEVRRRARVVTIF